MNCDRIVYAATHRPTGRQYIGSTRKDLGDRWKDHVRLSRRTNHPLYDLIRADGPEAFDVAPLSERLPSAEGFARERAEIRARGSTIPNGLNLPHTISPGKPKKSVS